MSQKFKVQDNLQMLSVDRDAKLQLRSNINEANQLNQIKEAF